MNLSIGVHDNNVSWPVEAYNSQFHDWPLSKLHLPANFLRGQKNGDWHGTTPFPSQGNIVASLQEGLRTLGFFPHGEIDGLYGYRTESAVRLFQEYAKVVEREPIEHVNGIAGADTLQILDKWLTPETAKRANWQGNRAAYDKAFEELNKLKARFIASDLPEKKLIEKFADRSATRSIADSAFDKNDIHLIGIRRKEDQFDARRKNNDLFILLIEGMRFVFRGSTNPHPNPKKRPDKAFLIRGQHEYRFGWHMISSVGGNPEDERVYRAFKPRNPNGPLVVRTINNKLTEKSFETAIRNPGINIHWSGAGTSNWSDGCQVIAGLKYIDFRDKLVDCSARAAGSYRHLSNQHTKGAYNVLLDLMTVFAKNPGTSGDSILYTLLYDDGRQTY